ncbi:serine hydrolase [Aurantiacibacter sp. MUD11]|uniref:serine hydrolase n=1 Tax=Aurantiacibacter sp. MUD11 TaxID=3003265 RepID=UPI0022AA24A8|nr:serine hydrolase [Aurantiacibacter sp. MUD11]WAT18382.1 serine hydrolase [Aurantiacibacter sp. MUD11]
MKAFHTAFAALLLAASPALGQTAEDSERLEQRAEDIVAAMGGAAVYDEVFADPFVNAVPEAQFAAIQQQLEAQFGPLIGIETVDALGPSAANIAIRFERGLANGTFVIEGSEPFEITGFRITDVRPIDDSVEQVLADLAALPGATGILVSELTAGGEVIAGHNIDRPFAIGSTFKLYVLSALARSIAAGERDWDDVVPLTERSYPSGQLQDWPEGAPVTLHTLATLMISISDNTATDQLMAVLGRDAVEAEVVASGHSNPDATFPFLTTREMFVLKSGDDVNLGEYAAAGTAERLAVLQGISAIERSEGEIMAAFAGVPNAIDVEWIATPADIAGLLVRLAELEDRTALEIMAVNPAMSDSVRADWQYAGYKGGSEPGVLNLTWLLQAADGHHIAVTMSWNDPASAVDQQAFNLLAMRAIALAGGTD